MSSELNRKKYWLRNFISFPNILSAPVNATHRKLAEWEKKGLLNYLITQNIERFLIENSFQNSMKHTLA